MELPDFKERPIINSVFMPSKEFGEPRSFDLRTLLWYIKRTPECIGILKRIATDIVTPISFTAVDQPKTAGRPAKSFKKSAEDKATEFSNKNLLKHKLLALVIDWAATGDFYLWKGKFKNDQIKEIANKHYKEYGLEIKEIDTKQFFDEDPNKINTVEIVPASTMEIFHDNFKITEYKQWVRSSPGERREFSVKEIIHGKFIEIDGSVYGFSPMEASFIAIKTIGAIQDYNYIYFENGAKLDRVWKFMGNPGREYIEKFKEDLAQYISNKKAHGHMVLSGADQIESETLNQITEEMEYRKLAIHCVGRLAHSFNMPADSLSPILGTDIKQAAGSSDVEDAGYNRNVERAQEYIEDLLNTQLFIPEFGVTIEFERQFRQDQIRQDQNRAMVLPYVEFLMKHEFPITDDYFIKVLQIPRSFLTEGKIKREIEEMTPQPFSIPKKAGDGVAKQANSEQKKKQQGPQARNNPPVGS
ncbi:MAG TPA: phage portal protein [bacterium]|nr:phage portal protein [bacterium]